MDGLARRARLARSRLYFVTDVVGEELLDAALGGGVDIVQLRAKDLSDDDLVAAAEPFRRACDRHGALFVLNDRPDLVERVGADGVHVGQGDMAVADARRTVGDERIVGLSTHSRDQMQDTGPADYIGVGTIFATPTKPDNESAGLELVRVARYAARLPWFAIGGIDQANVEEVVENGAHGIAVVRAIRDAADPEQAAQMLRASLPPSNAIVTAGDVCIPQLDWLRSANGKASPHVHVEHADVFHVLDGTMEFRAGDGTVRLPPGSTLAAPPLLVHGFRVPDGDARYLNVHAPGGWWRAPKETADQAGPERGDAKARPVVSAPGDGDRRSSPHRLEVVKVELPEVSVHEVFATAELEAEPAHVHLRHAECVLVLEGALDFTFGRVEQGAAAVIPPGVAHAFTVASERARWLDVRAPGAGAEADVHPLT